MLSDPTTAAVADGAANSGDGSAYFDDGTTDGTLADTSAGATVSNPDVATAATPTAASPASGGFFSSLFSAVTPALTAVGTTAADRALGAVATQNKTATTANAAAKPLTTSNSNTMILAAVGVLVALLFFIRRK